ncbi:alpha-xenorhabdolysin family binary toxin subunit A [Pseudomonas sp. UBA4617]|uniref:alpha-xenorhabdolysin family binary toxin subunit A n=1 Tax=Pseudomonas sp. UBA4617 TaxID=1947318 RepID=UPI0025EAE8E2|nr:alpha-xenorhabdolysin family binary toxin subunit A [Pseudomonas sp. UBA4617]
MGNDVAAPEALPYDKLTEDQRIELVPGQIFELKKNEPAFIFSRDNLRTIKRYEDAVRQLPHDYKDKLSETFAALGLDVADVNVFFENLRKHVNSWDRVEDACKTMGADLQVFAEDLIREAESLIGTIKTMDAWEAAASGADDGDSAVLSEDETSTFRETVDLHLSVITEDIQEKLTGIRTVKALIDRFGDDITETLHPMAKSLLNRIGDGQVSEALAKVEADIEALDIQIEEKLAEYHGLVGTAFYGLVFGAIGLAITGGIYGSKAENVRAAKNKLISERQELAENRAVLLGGQSDFEIIRTHIVDMQFRLVDVGTAVKNLEDVWVLMEAYAKNSRNRVDSVSTQLELKKFVDRFQRVISPWENILGISSNISRLFNEVLNEY